MNEVAVSAEDSATIEVPLLVDGEWRTGTRFFDSIDPYRGGVVSRAPETTGAELDATLDAARRAATEIAAMPGYERAALLRRVGEILVERADDIGRVMARETGKAIKDARAEVRRSKDTIQLSAEEAIRIEGQQVPLDGSEMGAGKLAFLLRFPVGVVGAITPFNAPFNLACHKIAPAIAAGNAVVIKPPPQCPLVLHRLAEIFVDAGVPKGVLNVVHGGAEVGRRLVQDSRVDFISFTGSSGVGKEIRSMAGLRRVALELGGNGPTILCQDADVEAVAPICARNAVRLAGQSCISVQNIFVHEALVDRFVEATKAALEALVVGDPLDQGTDVGTLIDETAAGRVAQWVDEAVNGGATIVTGGKRTGAQYAPTLLTNVSPDMKVVCEEIFGPVASVLPFSDLADPIAFVNRSRYGLQCGIYTDSTKTALRAVRELRTGGIIINGTNTWRTDQLAYGGVKESGIGREGPRYAIKDMTDQRLILFNL